MRRVCEGCEEMVDRDRMSSVFFSDVGTKHLCPDCARIVPYPTFAAVEGKMRGEEPEEESSD